MTGWNISEEEAFGFCSRKKYTKTVKPKSLDKLRWFVSYCQNPACVQHLFDSQARKAENNKLLFNKQES
jgi:hypothetical protein